MRTELRQGEQVIKEGLANFKNTAFYAGGKLYLTSQRLIFEANQLNVLGGSAEIELSSLQALRPSS